MAAYQLSYTAEEINNRLGKVPVLENKVKALETITMPAISCSSSFRWYGMGYTYQGHGLEEYYNGETWAGDYIDTTFPILYPEQHTLKYYSTIDTTVGEWSVTKTKDSYGMIHKVEFTSDKKAIQMYTRQTWNSSVTFVVKYAATVNGILSQITETVTGYLDYCLLKGTQILMSDFTTKPIEEVKSGDWLKSWDFDTNSYIDVRCLAAYETGADKEWTEYRFDDENILRIAHSHAIYNQEQGFPLSSTSWKIGNTGLGINGLAPKLTKIIEHYEESPIEHYTLLTENNIYFADGILCGNLPSKKYTIYRAGLMNCEITPEQLDLFKESHKLSHTNGDWKRDPRFIQEARKYGRYNEVKANVEILKDKIAARDYKTIKRMQGLLSDEEWEENLAICADLRTQINDGEALCKQILKHHADTREALGYPRKPINRAKCFQQGTKKDNEFIRIRNAQLAQE